MYNLNDNVEDSFEFQVDGHRYRMRYPTMEELETIQDAAREQTEKVKNGETVNDSEVTDMVYAYISSVDDAPPISGVIKKQSVRVIRNFQKMFKTEFGIE